MSSNIDEPDPMPREKYDLQKERLDHVFQKETKKTHAWTRFFARLADYCIILLILWFVFRLYFYPGKIEAIHVALFFVAFIWNFIEPIFIHFLGTTPGKWLFGISVRRSDGSKLSFGEAVCRSLSVWWLGLGAGIPIVSYITMIVANVKLSNLGATPWDSRFNYKIEHKPISFLRAFAIIIYYLVVFIALQIIP